jgi:hypothetical protein
LFFSNFSLFCDFFLTNFESDIFHEIPAAAAAAAAAAADAARNPSRSSGTEKTQNKIRCPAVVSKNTECINDLASLFSQTFKLF